jgi:hypothetical protein
VTHEADATPEPEAAPDAPLLALSLTAWFAASLVAWQQTTHKLDKLFDTQQMLFAKRLLTMDLDEIRAPAHARDPEKSEARPSRRRRAGFRHLRVDGKMLLNDGENGRDIPYHYRRDGFATGSSRTTTTNGVFMADLTRREIPRGGRPGVGVPPGYGAGRGQLAADALAGGAAGDAAVADSPPEPGAEAAEKAGADPALPLAGCHRCAADQGVPTEVRPCSTR